MNPHRQDGPNGGLPHGAAAVPAPPSAIPPAPPMPVPPVYGGTPPPAGADPRWAGRLSSPWRRLGAFLIDGLVFAPVGIAVIFGTIVPRFLNDPQFQRLQRLDAGRPLTQAEMEQIVQHFQSRFFLPLILIGVGMSVLTGIYTVLFTKLKGQTLGKMAVGIKVVHMLDGSLPTWGHAIARWALPAAAALVPTVGGLGWLLIYLWILWDPNKQGLHDKVAKTVVIRT
jgi:uncharacterized RDD family membrane protein YckC